MTHDELKSRIQQSGATARETLQLAKRLTQLLPQRMQNLYLRYRSEKNKRSLLLSLCDQEYLEQIDTLIAMRSQQRLARIDYESHVMLFQARQTLNRQSSNQHGQGRQKNPSPEKDGSF